MDRDTKGFDPAPARDDEPAACRPPCRRRRRPRRGAAGAMRRSLRKPRWRRVLMWGVPLAVVLIGGYLYVTGGRYVSTDDA